MRGHSDVDGAALVVESCAQSIAAGDGRELWQYLPSGQIASATWKKCISVGAGSVVSLKGCDASGSSQWEAQGSGAGLRQTCESICVHAFSKRPVALEWSGTHMFEHARLNSWHQRRFEVGDFCK